MKVADTNHLDMFATKYVTSQRQTRLCCSNGSFGENRKVGVMEYGLNET